MNLEQFCAQLERIGRLYDYSCPTYREYLAAAGLIRLMAKKNPEEVAHAESVLKEIFAGKDYKFLEA